MTDALLPPDPTRDGGYWISHPDFPTDVATQWSAEEQLWCGLIASDYMTQLGCTLASRYPIPGAAKLDALWEWLGNLENAVAAYSAPGVDVHWLAYQQTVAVRDRLRAVLKGDAT